MNQSELLAINCNLLKARAKSCVQAAISFGFAPHWLKNWHEILKSNHLACHYFRQSVENMG